MEHIGEKKVEEIEVPIFDEDGNVIDTRIEKKISWGLPKGVSGPYYDESITDADRLADAWDEVRQIRNYELKQMDTYQLTIPYSLLDNTQRAQLQIYRQALLDLPSAYSTPEEALLNMPTKPDWMN